MAKYKNIIQRLGDSISKDSGNMTETELSVISSNFSKILDKAMKNFNSHAFDDNGFIKKLKEVDFGDKKNRDVVKNILNPIKNEFVDAHTLNHSEILLRRDLFNVCTQMPEIRDLIYLMRDAIIESNVATGEVSRSLLFENHDDDGTYESQCSEVERKHDLLIAIKNFIIPRTLMIGELCAHVVPYAKLFAELDAVAGNSKNNKFRESIPNYIRESFKESKSLYTEDNLQILMESVSVSTKIDSGDEYKVSSNKNDTLAKDDNITKANLKALLDNIEISNGSSPWMVEMGVDGFKEFLYTEYKSQINRDDSHYFENLNRTSSDMFGKVDEKDIDFNSFKDIKGCYVKYLDALRLIPIRLDRRIIGYYYVTTTMDLQINPAQPNGIVDLSFQHYTKDKNVVSKLCSILIDSFDKDMLKKNIHFKNEIAEIIMAHRFTEGRLSFVFIPESEIIRFKVNEDENGKGHSLIEPTLFPARLHLMMLMYNILYILNNTMTRIHYVKSSGLDKNYAAQIQRTIRKFQARKITIDDIYSYAGVLNKIGGRGEMILPAGRGDYKAIETDTLAPADNPISVEFIEQQRRQALAGSGVPYLMATSAIDEVDFAKTMEMANARFISTVSSYKIDFNKGITELYKKLLRYETDIDPNVIQTFHFSFHSIKQQSLNITNEMIANFNAMVELVSSVYFSQDEIMDKEQKPTPTIKHLRKELAKQYLPQLDFDELDKLVDRVRLSAIDDRLENRIKVAQLTDDDVEGLSKKEEE